MPQYVWLAAVTLTLLAGCAATDHKGGAASGWAEHSAVLAELNNWTASGKVALRNREAAETATLTWSQSGAEARVQLSGPLGTGAMHFFSDGKQLRIQNGDDSRTVDISTPAAIEHNTGWNLPLQALPYWLKGLPFPHSAIEELSTDPASGHLVRLHQDGWEVHYEQYEHFDSFTLPTRMRIHKEDTRATVLLRRWRTGAG